MTVNSGPEKAKVSSSTRDQRLMETDSGFHESGQAKPLPGHRAILNRRDVIVFEQMLKDAIGSLIPFTSHSIHFPRSNDERSPEWLPKENKLMLPLLNGAAGETSGKAGKTTLGVFMARGVDKARVPALLSLWPSISVLLTHNLLLHKQSLSDPATGLASRHYLLECMAREIESLRDPFSPVPSPSSGNAEKDAETSIPSPGSGRFAVGGDLPRRPSMGTLVVRMAELRDVVREFGYQFADQLMTALADALISLCPEQALAARTGDSEFALHIPSATPKECRRLAKQITAHLSTVTVTHPLHREQVGIRASVGYTLYPHDMGGDMFVRPPSEQARLILRKARLAAALADEDRPVVSSVAGAAPVLGFGQILTEGGRVLETLPLARVVVNLGAGMHAREGQRFSVWSVRYPVRAAETADGETPQSAKNTERAQTPPLYKGEIVLMEVEETASQGEIIHLGDPAWNIEPGDRLVLLPEELDSFHGRGQTDERRDPATGLLRHGDFFIRFAEQRESCQSFSLALVRFGGKIPFQQNAGETTPSVDPGKTPDEDWEDTPDGHETDGVSMDGIMGRAVQLCREELGAQVLGGRYGLNSLIFFHPSLGEEETAAVYKKLTAVMEKQLEIDISVGIAGHPCLDFRKTDTLENCRKALEYAMLLPRPRVGVLDTLALNISADKRFSHGDTFGAIKEYQLALLAEESNSMAWNSLGVCLAGMGRQAEAERHFQRALEHSPDDPAVLYNLGFIYQSQGKDAEAGRYYEQCLANAAEHYFSFVRLGQLAENGKNPQEARKWYEKAAALPGGKGPTCRHFARLCLSEGNTEEAREHLHEALLHDPQDAFALQLLARVYLDAGEDPELAASLARQSVALRPALKSGWLELARALSVMGKEQQAREARLRAV